MAMQDGHCEPSALDGAGACSSSSSSSAASVAAAPLAPRKHRSFPPHAYSTSLCLLMLLFGLIHRHCNTQRIAQQRANASHVKREVNEGATADLPDHNKRPRTNGHPEPVAVTAGALLALHTGYEAAASTPVAAAAASVAASSILSVAASASSFPRQFPAHVFDVVRCLRDRGFAFAPEFGKEFAHAYIKHMGKDIATRKKERIAGEVEQYTMPPTGTSPWPTTLRSQWDSLVARLAEHVGVDPEQLHVLIGTRQSEEVHGGKPQLHVQDAKLLMAGRQKGEQAPHFDRDDSADKLKQVYTVILYLTDGVDSTAFPQFPLAEFALPEFNAEEDVLNADAMRATVQRGHLDKEHYDRWTVRVGDMALFTQATMHFGTKNNILHERMALFSVLTPFAEKRQDDYQIYRWMYVGFAFGDQSRELAEAVWRDREFQPLDRFSADEAGRQSYEAYILCLVRWGFIHWNPRARKGQQVQWAREKEHRSSALSDEEVEQLYLGD